MFYILRAIYSIDRLRADLENGIVVVIVYPFPFFCHEFDIIFPPFPFPFILKVGLLLSSLPNILKILFKILLHC